jgi:FkbM family methyltransferase
MTFVSYAQNFEDVILWRALHDVRNGRYLDIGAQDPVVDSVSLAFYEAGWRGINVEPTPAYAGKLREARPDEIVIQAAVSDGDRPIEFYEFPDTGLSTGRAPIAEQHAINGYLQRKIIVPSVKLAHLLDAEGTDFHWVKIDVEGMEPEVLRSWGVSERRPWMLVVEATYPLTQKAMHETWFKELSGRGYREVHFDGLSRYFLHETQAHRGEAFEAPPNVFDEFAITRRHFSAVSISGQLDTLEDHVNRQQIHASDLQFQLVTLQQQQFQEQEERIRLQAAAEQAAQERDVARVEQVATYDAWVQADRESRAELQRLHLKGEETEAALRAHSLEKERLLERTQGSLAAVREHGEQLKVELDQVRKEREGLNLRRLELGIRVADMEALITKALAAPATRWQRLGRAIGLAGEDSVKAELAVWKSTKSQSNVQLLEPDMPAARSPEMKFCLHANSLSELLSLDGKDFVRSAYATMLGREADPEGEAYYVGRREADIPKLQILYEMRKSPEAKLLLDPLPGLDEAFGKLRRSWWFRGRKSAAEAIEARVTAESDQAHVQQFMQYYDEEFVRIVYRYYLAREPDQAGLDYYVNLIRRGASRQQIFIDIAKSREALLRGRKAIGQNALKTAMALDKIPIIGTLISIFRFNMGIRRHLQDMRAMQNYLYRFAKKIG